MPRGRPTSYKPETAEQARKLCLMGATDIEVADFFSIHVATLYRWSQQHPEFREALKAGKEALDERVEKSLFHRAVGYSRDSVKIFQHEGKAVKVPYREHVAPDTTAMIFWLKNRRPREWRDRIQVDASVRVVADEMTDDELAALAKGGKGGE
jgi:hypothetical protein